MAKAQEIGKIGDWAFIGGVLIAVLVGLVPGLISDTTTATLLVILGILVGLVKIGGRETQQFLVAAISLLVAKAAGLDILPLVGVFLGPILTNIATFVAPAAVIVALKAVYEIGR